jgi:hypothetical protein
MRICAPSGASFVGESSVIHAGFIWFAGGAVTTGSAVGAAVAVCVAAAVGSGSGGLWVAHPAPAKRASTTDG